MFPQTRPALLRLLTSTQWAIHCSQWYLKDPREGNSLQVLAAATESPWKTTGTSEAPRTPQRGPQICDPFPSQTHREGPQAKLHSLGRGDTSVEGDKGHRKWGLTVEPGPDEKHTTIGPPGSELSLSITHGRDLLSVHPSRSGAGSGGTLQTPEHAQQR